MNVPDDVYEGLCKIQNDYNDKICDKVGTCSSDKDISAAFEWLGNYIRQGDAFEWAFEIVDLDE